MPSLLFCGPKMAACGMVISIWGVIMLAMLGIFFSAKSAVLIEDVPFTEEDIRNESVLPARLLLLLLPVCRSNSTPSSEHLRSLQPSGHQLLHRGCRLRGGGRRVAVPGSTQQAAGVHGDLRWLPPPQTCYLFYLETLCAHVVNFPFHKYKCVIASVDLQIRVP